jgi:hypothetical protein
MFFFFTIIIGGVVVEYRNYLLPTTPISIREFLEVERIPYRFKLQFRHLNKYSLPISTSIVLQSRLKFIMLILSYVLLIYLSLC